MPMINTHGFIKLMINDNPIWKDASATALDYIPPIGSHIRYKKFQDDRETQELPPEVLLLEVNGITFETKEHWNGLYAQKNVLVHCTIIGQK